MISKLALAIRGFKVGTYTMEHVVSCMASGCREDDFECPVGQSFIVGESLNGTSMGMLPADLYECCWHNMQVSFCMCGSALHESDQQRLLPATACFAATTCCQPEIDVIGI